MLFSQAHNDQISKRIGHITLSGARICPPWNRNLMPTKLMGSPFEPLAIFSLLNLSMKVIFLLQLPARGVGELRVLVSEPSYIP